MSYDRKNPPAFAHGNPEQGGDPGMSMRDYFAGQAMAGLCAHPEAGELPNDSIACLSFALADAMLKARESSQ